MSREIVNAPNFADVEEAVEKERSNRIVSWYVVPESLSKKLKIKKVGLVELTSDEELMCAGRSRNEQVRLAMELLKESVRYVDDRKINTGDGSADTFWASKAQGMSSLRQLLLLAYNQVHNPTQSDVSSFLDSRQITI